MKSLTLLLMLLFLGCRSSEFNYVGTTGSRYGLSPYPSKEKWTDILEVLSRDNKRNPMILWVVGSYTDKSIKFNFPGKDNPDFKILYSDIDLNEEYLKFFDKKGIDVFLMVEPGDARINEVVKRAVNTYSHHSSVKGICIDLEWYRVNENNPFGTKLDSHSIKSLLFHLKKEDPKLKLILKHWNINNMDHYPSRDIVYLQSLEGVDSLGDVKDRYLIWYKKFYPSKVGVEAGFVKSSLYWSSLKNPLESFPLYIDRLTDNKSVILWSESYIEKFNTINN